MDAREKYAKIFAGVVLFTMFLWLCQIFLEGFESTQFNLFFRRCQDLFADFTNICGYSADGDVYCNPVNGFEQKAYPPLPYVIALIFSRIIVNPSQVYRMAYVQPQYLITLFIMLTFVMVSMYALISSELKGATVIKFLCGIAITFSGPMLCLVERANVLLFVILFCMVYIFWYDSESKIKRETALIALSFAVAFKLSPVVFGIFLLYDKRYKDIVKVAIYSIALVVLPFLCFDGGFANIPLLMSNLKLFIVSYGHDSLNLHLEKSLFGLLTIFDAPQTLMNNGYIIAFSETTEFCSRVLSVLSAIFLLITAPLQEKRWEKILAVSILLVFLPKISLSYNILYLLPSLVLFLNEEKKDARDIVCLIAYILLCSVYFVNFQINYQLPMMILYAFMMIRAAKCLICTKNSIGQGIS